MSTTTTAASALLFSVAFTLIFSLAQGLINTHNSCDDQKGSTLQIIHENSPCSPYNTKPTLSWRDTVLQMQSNDEARLQYLSSLVAGRSSVVPISYGMAVTQNSTYIVRANIGTPAQTLLAAIDTSNDAAMIPCTGCSGCSPKTTFNPGKSSTFKPVPCGSQQCKQVPNPSCMTNKVSCGFNLTYGGSFVTGRLVQDNIALTTDSIPRYTFGCVDNNPRSSLPVQGLLGLGRGPLSFLSQSKDLYSSTFSYCLPSYNSANVSGSLILGPNSQPIIKNTTPLLQNPKRPSLYYVNLTGIKVRKTIVKIPLSAFAFDTKTGGGTIFDSGTMFTSLVKPAYLAVRDEVRFRMGKKAKVSSLGGFDTCYTNVTAEAITKAVPTITFMFSGMDMKIPMDNFIIWRTGWKTACLAMSARPDSGSDSVLNVIASFQQQNQHILIDGHNSRIGVSRHEPYCSS